MIDPVTFEVLRHRLTMTIEEGALALRDTSGSPTVAQMGDCNVALLDAAGECVLVGRTIPDHATSCISTVRYIMQEYRENPGYGPGDLFLSNDPYVSTPHQNCIVVVGPLYVGDAVLGWTGAGIHVGDMGGPIPGQAAVGAQSIWEEPSRMPPVRLVERGVIRKDLEADFLARSRTPLNNSMDMRAVIAGNTTMQARFADLVRRYGGDTVREAMARILDVGEARLRALLRDIPDGAWEDTAYLDYQDRGERLLYAIHVTMSKRDDRLVFDFAGSSEQAPAVINATMPALRARITTTLRPYFAPVIGFSPAPLMRVVDVLAPPGTVVNCTFPAGMCKGTTSAVYLVEQLVARTVTRMLSASERDRGRGFMVRGLGAAADIVGLDQFGHPYGGVMPRMSQAYGSGARAGRDGLDTGGRIEPDVAMPNVETAELRYPLLFLYQRQAADTAGPGHYRGGVAGEEAFLPHDVPSVPNMVFHMHGVFAPAALGIYGGYPGFNEVTVRRDTEVPELFARGVLPASRADLETRVGGTLDVPPSFGRSYLGGRDVYVLVGNGGGGIGDPLERDPERVAADVRGGMVSEEWAARAYGVVVADGQVQPDATAQRRRAIRDERRRLATPPAERAPGPIPDSDARAEVVGRINDYLQLARIQGQVHVRCACGALLGPPDRYRRHLATLEVPCLERQPHYMRYVESPPLRFREEYCPACFLLHEVELVPAPGTSVRFVGPPPGPAEHAARAGVLP